MSQFISLTQYQLIEAHGADAEKYLQGRISTWLNDVHSTTRLCAFLS